MSTRYVWNKYTQTTSTTYDTNFTEAVRDISSSSLRVASSFTIQNNKFVPSGSTAYIYVWPDDLDQHLELSQRVQSYPYVFSPNGDRMWYSDGNAFSSNAVWRLINLASSYNYMDIYDDYQGDFEERTNPRPAVSQGSYIDKVSSSSSGTYPSNDSSGNYWYVYQGFDNIDPSSVSYSTTSPTAGSSITIIATTRDPSYGGTVYYQFSYSTNGGSSWTNIGDKTTSSSASVTVPSGASQFRGRVVASDGWGFTSTTYTTGNNLTVSSSGGGSTETSGEGAAYVGVSGKARSVSKIYVGVNGKAREVVKGYVGVGGKARQFWPRLSQYVISLIANPSSGGTVSGGGTYEKDSSATVNATANSGYRFRAWQKNGSNISTSSRYSFTVREDAVLTALFDRSNYYSLSLAVSPPGAGTVSGSGTYEENSSVTVTATPTGNNKFVSWQKNGSNISTSSRYSFTITGNTSLTALFKKSIQWGTFSLPSHTDWYDITYGNGMFVAVGCRTYSGDEKDYGSTAYSRDGINWTYGFFGGDALSGVTYGNGKFVAIHSGTRFSKCIYSSDGINWSYSNTFPNKFFGRKITYGNGRFVATGGTAGESEFMAAYSTDGINWQIIGMPIIASWDKIAYGNGKFVSIPSISRTGNAHTHIAYSSEGINWYTAQTDEVNNYKGDIVYGNGNFIVGYSEATTLAFSSDGVNWSKVIANPPYRTQALAHGNNKFIAFADKYGDSAVGNYLNDWDLLELPIEVTSWAGATYGEGKFVALSTDGRGIYSDDL